MNELQRNSLYYFFGRAITAFISLLSIPLFIFYFGKNNYGEYIIKYAELMIVITAISGWLCQGLMRYYSPKQYFNNVFLSVCGFVLVLSVVLSLIYVWAYNDTTLNMLFFCLTILCASIYQILCCLLHSQLKPMVFGFVESIRSIVLILLPTAMYFFDVNINGYDALLYALFASYLISSIVTYKCIDLSYLPLSNARKIKQLKLILVKIFRYSSPMFVWMLSASLMLYLDRFVIKHYYSNDKVAEYAAAYDIIYKFFVFAVTPVITSLMPIMLKNIREGKSETRMVMKQAYQICFAIALVSFICIGFFIFLADKYTDVVIMENISELYMITFFILISSLLWQLSMVAHKPLEINNKTLLMSYSLVFCIVIKLIISFPLVKYFSLVGASMSSMICYFIYFILMFNYDRKML